MHKKRSIFLFVTTILIILILLYPIQIARIGIFCNKIYHDNVVKIEFLQKNSKHSAYGIIVDDSIILTVAHLFDSEIRSYDNINEYTYIHIDDSIYQPMNIYVDFNIDLCALMVTAKLSSISKFNEDFNNCAYVVRGDNSIYKVNVSGITNVERNSCLTQLITINHKVKKGESGLPVIDNSGAVIGILSANDKLYDRAYVIPYAVIRSFLQNLNDN